MTAFALTLFSSSQTYLLYHHWSEPTRKKALLFFVSFSEYLDIQRVRDDNFSSKWSGAPGNCSNCDHYPGDVTHYFSGNCPALSASLQNSLYYTLFHLPCVSDLASSVHSALYRSSLEWAQFILDPTSDPQVISIKQEYGVTSIWPLLKLGKA